MVKIKTKCKVEIGLHPSHCLSPPNHYTSKAPCSFPAHFLSTVDSMDQIRTAIPNFPSLSHFLLLGFAVPNCNTLFLGFLDDLAAGCCLVVSSSGQAIVTGVSPVVELPSRNRWGSGRRFGFFFSIF